ncbi:MAG: 4Fe-4S binding protein [Candidatus Omnitrophica bacterium]|nr:4Fe-4S binding protein [Candidatus Omnitrophota bacterium]
MKVFRIRTITQIIFFFILLYGSYIGLRFMNFMPTWACTNPVDYSSACYLLPMQRFQYGLNPYLMYSMPFPGYFIMQGWMAFLFFFLYLIIFIIIFNKLWCGWICPFGTLQDGISFIRKKLKIRETQFSEKTKHSIRPIKYLLIILNFVMPFGFAFGAVAATPIFCRICPVKTLLPPLHGNILNLTIGFPPGVVYSIITCIFAAFILIMIFFRERFFCTICPICAMIHIFHKSSLLQFKKNVGACDSCGNCWRVCPVDIKEVYLEKKKENVIQENCNLCLKCIEACPQKGALSIKYFNKTIFSSSREYLEKIIGRKGKKKNATDNRPGSE